jgi:hypothetical protein
MKKLAFLSTLILALSLGACDTLQQVAKEVVTDTLSNDQIAGGLKEALNLGISNGANLLSQKGGYFNSAYKILLPAEARAVTEKLKVIPGFSQVENIIVEKINSGAEDAATKAAPIFANAIKNMTFSDALNILMGDANSATTFLKNATYKQLYAEFSPVIVSSLDKYSARKYWSDAIGKYNSIPFIDKVNPSLDDYVTTQALTGLFSMVESKEKSIRGDKNERITDTLKKVFAKQDKK